MLLVLRTVVAAGNGGYVALIVQTQRESRCTS
jgi:hypothetical protein